MPMFRVTAFEKFVVQTHYEVEADSPEDAERLCREGDVGYTSLEVQEGDEEWLYADSIEDADGVRVGGSGEPDDDDYDDDEDEDDFDDDYDDDEDDDEDDGHIHNRGHNDLYTHDDDDGCGR